MDSSKATGKSRLVFAAKLAVTLLILGLVGSRVNWPSIVTRLADASIFPLLAALVLFIATNVIVGVRWKLLANRLSIPIPLGRAIELIFASLFLGQVLPGAVGGDVVRFWLAWRLGQPPGITLASIVADRIVALAGIVVAVVAISLPLLSGAISLPLTATTGLVILLAVVGVAASAAAPWLSPLRSRLARWPWVHRFVEMIGDIRRVLLSPAACIGLGISVLIQLIGVVAIWLIALGLHLPIEFTQCLAVVPLAVLAAAVPISINGWGVRESAMIAGLGLYGVPLDDALIVSLLTGLGAVIASLPGLVFWRTMARN